MQHLIGLWKCIVSLFNKTMPFVAKLVASIVIGWTWFIHYLIAQQTCDTKAWIVELICDFSILTTHGIKRYIIWLDNLYYVLKFRSNNLARVAFPLFLFHTFHHVVRHYSICKHFVALVTFSSILQNYQKCNNCAMIALANIYVS